MRRLYTENSTPTMRSIPETEEIRKKLSSFALSYPCLYHGIQEDGGEYNDGPGPKTRCHFVQVAKKNEGHNDAVHRLKVGDERHSKGRKLFHYRYAGHVCKRCTNGAEYQ